MADTPIDALIAEFARLRDPETGCVWNREQTHRSLVRYLIEEVYELVDAIEQGDRDGMLEELGDVLYQLVFHADLAATTEGEGFDLQDVAARATEKMVRRHPHVFGDADAPTVEQVLEVWNAAKQAEKHHRTSVLDGIPWGMPSLLLAEKLLGRAQRVGLTVESPPIRSAVTSVAAPAGTAREGVAPDAPDAEAELGRTLLSIAAEARVRGLDAERALRTALAELAGDIRTAEAAGGATA